MLLLALLPLPALGFFAEPPPAAPAGTIRGAVCMDLNENGQADPGERLPWVRIEARRRTQAMSDEEGRWSFETTSARELPVKAHFYGLEVEATAAGGAEDEEVLLDVLPSLRRHWGEAYEQIELVVAGGDEGAAEVDIDALVWAIHELAFWKWVLEELEIEGAVEGDLPREVLVAGEIWDRYCAMWRIHETWSRQGRAVSPLPDGIDETRMGLWIEESEQLGELRIEKTQIDRSDKSERAKQRAYDRLRGDVEDFLDESNCPDLRRTADFLLGRLSR